MILSPQVEYEPQPAPRRVSLILPELWGRCGDPNTQHGFILDGERVSICAAGTKSGKTHGCACWAIREAFRMPNRLGGWAAPTYRQARIGLDLVCRLIPTDLRLPTEAGLKVQLLNGSVIEFRSCEDPDNLYGFEYHFGVVDEASRIREAAWPAIQSWFHKSRGPIKIIANAKGKRNWFYREFDRARSGEPGMSAHHLRSSQNPHLPEGTIEEAQRRLPDRVYRELYEAEFLDDSASPFSNWASCVDMQIAASPKSGQTYVGGVDLGRHESYTVAIVGKPDGTAVNMARWQGLPWHATRARLKRLSNAYGGVSWLVDASGVGDSVAEHLARDGLHIDEFKFSAKSKSGMLGDLIGDVESEDIKFPDWPQLAHELEVIEATRLQSGLWSYRAPENDFDDCVMALGLYNRQRRNAPSGGPESMICVG